MTTANPLPLRIRRLGLQEYLPTWKAMRAFTDTRSDQTCDELWMLEHPPVFTLGQAGKALHVLDAANIPVVKSDRGGQVTYHGPGQLVAYPLLDLKRLGFGVRELVTRLERSVIDFLSRYDVLAVARRDAPGVYVDQKKIASLGLRVRRGASYHGVAVNIDMDLSPFAKINPCGYPGMEMVCLSDLLGKDTHVGVNDVISTYATQVTQSLNMRCVE